LDIPVPNAYFLLLFQLINANAPGNQPTEGLMRYFHSLGIDTGIDEQKGRFCLEAQHFQDSVNQPPLPLTFLTPMRLTGKAIHRFSSSWSFAKLSWW
jgi:hypothetical protein